MVLVLDTKQSHSPSINELGAVGNKWNGYFARVPSWCVLFTKATTFPALHSANLFNHMKSTVSSIMKQAKCRMCIGSPVTHSRFYIEQQGFHWNNNIISVLYCSGSIVSPLLEKLGAQTLSQDQAALKQEDIRFTSGFRLEQSILLSGFLMVLAKLLKQFQHWLLKHLTSKYCHTTGEEQWTEWTNTCFARFSTMLINFLIVLSQPEGIVIYLPCYCTAHRKNTNTPVLSLSETKSQSTRDTIRILWLRSSRFKKFHLPWSSTWRE